ncbi:hypothetical protein TZ03_11485 [Pseudomonas sp. 10-1B]|nr:hypothetical protein TZ03_11485 [Pseudomonas sp. 10-1B]
MRRLLDFYELLQVNHSLVMKTLSLLDKSDIIDEFITASEPSVEPVEVASVDRVSAFFCQIHVEPFESSNVLAIGIEVWVHDAKQLWVLWVVDPRRSQYWVDKRFMVRFVLVAICAHHTQVFRLKHECQMLGLRHDVFDWRSCG